MQGLPFCLGCKGNISFHKVVFLFMMFTTEFRVALALRVWDSLASSALCFRCLVLLLS